MAVSNLVWMGNKERILQDENQKVTFLDDLFPNVIHEHLDFSETEDKLIPKKVALQYQRWAEDKALNNLGLICEDPVGFDSWNSFLDFVRMEPPAFLWKLKSKTYLKPHKILVPVDFSSGTERLLPMIKDMTEVIGGKDIVLLNLFTCKNNARDNEELMSWRKDKIEEMRWYFEANLGSEILDKLRLEAIPKIKFDNAELLQQYISANDIELVILGSHNFNHYHYLLYGSTASELLKSDAPAHVCVIF